MGALAVAATVGRFRLEFPFCGNEDYALAAGLQPTKDAIALEDVNSPYANLIAVRKQDKDKPWVKKLAVAAYQSKDVRQFIKTQFKGSVEPSF